MVGPSQPTHRYLTLCSCALHSLFSYFWQHSAMFKWVNDSVTNISAEENQFYHCSMWKLQYANSKYQVHEEKTNLEPLYAWCSRQNSQQLHNTLCNRNDTNVFWLIDQSASWENLVYSRWWVNPWPCSLPVVTKLRQNRIQTRGRLKPGSTIFLFLFICLCRQRETHGWSIDTQYWCCSVPIKVIMMHPNTNNLGSLSS